MNTLFTSLDQVREYVNIDISGNFKTINPYLVEAHKYVLKGMDKVTFNDLVEYANGNDFDDDDKNNLLDYSRRVLANFAYAISAKRLGVYVGENGILSFNNGNLEQLSPERLDQIKTEFYNSGFNALEQLTLFIKANATAYADAYEYLFVNSFFISTADELNSTINTDVQNRDYFEMKPDIYLIEKEIEGIITKTTFDALKTAIDSDDLNDNQQAMLDIIKPAECCIAYGNKFKSDVHVSRGKALLEQLRALYNTITSVVTDNWSNEGKNIYVFK